MFDDWNSLSSLKAMQRAISHRMHDVQMDLRREFRENPYRFTIKFEMWAYEVKDDKRIGTGKTFRPGLEHVTRRRNKTIDVLVSKNQIEDFLAERGCEGWKYRIYCLVYKDRDQIDAMASARPMEQDHWEKALRYRVV